MPIRTRLEFETPARALIYRRDNGSGGWVLGRFLYVGAWTPSAIMRDCPEDGTLR